MDAAVVELDPLADPVRAGAEDHHRAAVAAPDLRGGPSPIPRALVGGIVVGGRGLELGGAGVDRLEGPLQSLGPVALGGEDLQLAQEPAVDQAALVDGLDREAAAERLEDQVEAFTQPISPLIAGPLADFLLEPAMKSGSGPLPATFGWLVGIGPGAGMALMFVITGLLTSVVGASAYFFSAVRNAEDVLPDHEALAPAAPPSEATA